MVKRSVDLLNGIAGWPKAVAYLGALGVLLTLTSYLLAVVGPRQQADFLREMQTSRDREDARLQKLLERIDASGRACADDNRDTREVLRELTAELRRHRLAQAAPPDPARP